MFLDLLWRGFKLIGLLSLFTLLLLLLPHWVISRRYSPLIHTPEVAPDKPVAIVFGAGLRRDGSPTQVLADRVITAAELYRHGKVEGLLLTGSRGEGSYDESMAMQSLALQLGVPGGNLMMDAAGHRTLDSCRRAIEAFGIQQALLVTQEYHLPRALYLCDVLGMEAEGVAADRRPYRSHARRFWQLREIPATLVAILETLPLRPDTPSTSALEEIKHQEESGHET